MIASVRRIAVVVFNLGGPDSPGAVRGFLINLFRDPAILRVPGWLRPLLAWLIVARRLKTAQAIYAQLGGRSPIREQTTAQALALEAALTDLGIVRCFVAMRYWHPMSEETAKAVQSFAPDEIVLLPLYPQYSTTTTASSLDVWLEASRAAGIGAPTQAICCYPDEPGFIAAQSEALRRARESIPAGARARILFSAHGLPKKIVEEGDPYAWQVERTAEAIAEAAGLGRDEWRVTYQSRVGPLKWLEPYTEDEIVRAGREGMSLIVQPIAFVSEHSETLVELDRTYADLAQRSGVPNYRRVATVGTMASFIAGLAALVRSRLDKAASPLPVACGVAQACGARFPGCALRRNTGST